MPQDGHFTVNWKSPMLLDDRHLTLADECARDARRWLARAIAPAVGGFGLLPLSRGGAPGLELTHEHGADRLTVHLHRITALAPDGSVLAFDEKADSELKGVASASVALERNPVQPQRFGVIVERLGDDDPNAYIELGQPDPSEDPPRRPMRAARMRLRLEENAHSARAALRVAEFIWDGLDVSSSSDHLPAAMTLAASPELARCAVDVRRQADRLLETLRAGAMNESGAGEGQAMLGDVVLPWLAALAATVDGLPLMSEDQHPYIVWDSCVRMLRVSRAMLGARPAARDHALQSFVQPGHLSSGNTRHFEDLESFLGEPYDHDGLGRCLNRASELISATREVVEHLLGAAPEVAEAPVETDVYFYKEKKYRLTSYVARTFELDDAWHTCFLRELNVAAPKSLLLVCDNSLLEQNPRPNAGLWMVDKYERVKANMFRVNVDNTTDDAKLLALFSDIGEPTVESISIASRGLLNLSGLGAEADEKIRIYYEE